MCDDAKTPYIEQIKQEIMDHFYLSGGFIIGNFDQDFTFEKVDKQFLNYVGYTPEELWTIYQNKGRKLLHPEDEFETIASLIHQVETNADQTYCVKGRYWTKEHGYKLTDFSGRVFYDADGKGPFISFALTDVSDQPHELLQLEKSTQFNEIVDALSDDIFFDVDLRTKTARYAQKFTKHFAIDEVLENYPQSILESGIVASESVELFERRYQNLKIAPSEEELHFIGKDGKDYWYMVYYRLLLSGQGEPVRVIGKMNDITKQHEKIHALQEQANRDQLTGLYNKAATEKLIKKQLETREAGEKFALILIDVDNFKSVNDAMGHIYGDALLIQQAKSLRSIFRVDDVLGRIGGDEFFVFMKNYHSLEVLQRKATEICELFSRTYIEHGVTLEISASIGISLCPEHDDAFDQLYKKADSALYRAKSRGKNCFCIYSQKQRGRSYVARGENNVMNFAKKGRGVQLAEHLFRMLYATPNIDSAIQQAVQQVTEQFDFSRGYIFEFDRDNNFINNTFEWCQYGIRPMIDDFQHVHRNTFETSFQYIQETGLFLAENLSKIPNEEERKAYGRQNIKSFIIFGIQEKGNLIGAIGFDDCMKERSYLLAEIDELRLVSNVIGLFLSKYRLEKKHRWMQKTALSTLENIAEYAYVVDAKDYRILYENNKVVARTGQNHIDEICYEAYWNKQQPCADCPLQSLDGAIAHHTIMTKAEQPETLFETTGCSIDWMDDQKAYFVSSKEITNR